MGYLMSKFAVYSDLHLHPWEYGSYQMREGGNSRLHEQGSFLFWLGKFCKDRSIKELFFCGDFFHTHGRVSTEALFLATRGVQYISAQGVSQFLLVGNHDISRNFKDKFPLEPNSLEEFSPFGNIVSSPIIGKHLTHPNITISMIPFTESRSLLAQNLELVRRVATIHPHYLFLHQGVAQVPMGSGHLIDEILTPEMIPDNIARAFTGHYHTHKDL
jgi:DNA repair exonuclease SbcCD nuclease subunit